MSPDIPDDVRNVLRYVRTGRPVLPDMPENLEDIIPTSADRLVCGGGAGQSFTTDLRQRQAVFGWSTLALSCELKQTRRSSAAVSPLDESLADHEFAAEKRKNRLICGLEGRNRLTRAA